jgi:hypothetical protein
MGPKFDGLQAALLVKKGTAARLCVQRIANPDIQLTM